MKKISTSILIFALCANIFAMANPKSVKNPKTNPMPQWVLHPEQEYNSRYYLTGVGSGNDDNASEEDAKADLIKVIRQAIQAEQNVKTYGDKYDEQSIYSSDIDTFTELKSVSGIKIVEKYYASENKVYSLAVLKRQDAADYYANLINSNDEKIVSYMESALGNPGTIQSCIYAQKAFDLGKENEYYSTVLQLINPPLPKEITKSYDSFAQLSDQVIEIKKQVKLRIDVKGDNKDSIKTAITKSYAALGIPTSEASDAKYIVKAVVTMDKAVSPDEKHIFYNYQFNAELFSKENSFVVHSFSTFGRAGHLNDQGAKTKAYLNLVKEIEKDYCSNLSSKIELN